MHFPKSLRLACILMAMGLECARAQSTLGVIGGTVRDSSGATVVGASVSLRNLDENAVSTLASSQEGSYQFLNLRSGRYTVSVEKPGFVAASTPEIPLDARQTRQADFTLQVAGRPETLVVTSEVPLVNTDSGAISDT